MTINNFYKICDEIKSEWRSPQQVKEKHFIDALKIIKENESYKQEVLKYFIAIMKGEIDMPPELIEFCMRELQWPEIKNFANQQLKNSDPRRQRLIEHVLEVYEEEWEDADLYEYYSKEVKK